jgi:hypothetical protein
MLNLDKAFLLFLTLSLLLFKINSTVLSTEASSSSFFSSAYTNTSPHKLCGSSDIIMIQSDDFISDDWVMFPSDLYSTDAALAIPASDPKLFEYKVMGSDNFRYENILNACYADGPNIAYGQNNEAYIAHYDSTSGTWSSDNFEDFGLFNDEDITGWHMRLLDGVILLFPAASTGAETNYDLIKLQYTLEPANLAYSGKDTLTYTATTKTSIYTYSTGTDEYSVFFLANADSTTDNVVKYDLDSGLTLTEDATYSQQIPTITLGRTQKIIKDGDFALFIDSDSSSKKLHAYSADLTTDFAELAINTDDIFYTLSKGTAYTIIASADDTTLKISIFYKGDNPAFEDTGFTATLSDYLDFFLIDDESDSAHSNLFYGKKNEGLHKVMLCGFGYSFSSNICTLCTGDDTSLGFQQTACDTVCTAVSHNPQSLIPITTPHPELL